MMGIWVPENAEQIIIAIKHSAASSWFSSLRLMKILFTVGKEWTQETEIRLFFVFAQSKVPPFQHTFYNFLNVALNLSSQPTKVACLVLANFLQVTSSTSWNFQHLVSFIVLWLSLYKIGRSFRISAVDGSSVLGSSSRSSHPSSNLLTIESHM